MKTKAVKLLLILTVALLAITLARAQTTNPPPSIQGFASTIGSWVTSENPANRFQDAQFWTGIVYQNNVNVANETGASLDIWRQNKTYFPYTTNAPSSTLFFAVESRTRMAGIGGVFQSQNAGGEFGYMQNDIRAGLFLDGVYRFNTTVGPTRQAFGGEVGVFFDKCMSPTVASGIFLSYQTGQTAPLFGVNLNISFGNGSGFLGLF